MPNTALPPPRSPQAADDGNDTSMDRDSGGAVRHLLETTTGYLRRPQDDIREVIREASAVKLFWYDMRLRPYAWAHRLVLVAGLIIFVSAIGSVIGMAVDRSTVEDREFVHYTILERTVAAVAQAIFSTRAICIENQPLLIVANLNALGLLIRTALKVMMEEVANYTFLGLVALGFAMHLGASGVAIHGKLERFSHYIIGSQVHIQRMYRDYQTYAALALLDLECAILAVASVFFFMETRWYWFVAFGGLCFVTVANGSLLRHFIQTETTRWGFAALVPVYIALPVGCCVAMWYHDFVELDIPRDTKPLVLYSTVSFVVARTALLVAASKCFFQFGNGMKEAFETANDAVDFVRQEASTTYYTDVAAFLALADDDTEPQSGYGAA